MQMSLCGTNEKLIAIVMSVELVGRMQKNPICEIELIFMGLEYG